MEEELKLYTNCGSGQLTKIVANCGSCTWILSRNFNDDMEWMLQPSVFLQIEQKFGQIEIDMFASHLNYQKPEFVSFYPDKLAVATDAFTLNWNNYQNIYLFPPFSVICRTLQKLVKVKVNRLVLKAPIWPTQVWFSTLLHLISEQSYIYQRIEFNFQNKQTKTPDQEPTVGSFHIIRENLKGRGLSEVSIDVIMQSSRKSTCQQYGSYL